jgi:methylated-DNA-[protein]-cysteine S-methyltransferase
MDTCYIETPLGVAKITGDKNGISAVSLLDNQIPPSANIPESLLNCVTQLKAYFNEDLKSFDLPLNPEGSSFQKKVWEELQKIPFGKTISYLDLSKQLGDVKAIRAVAGANGKNPLWIIVPCHRVIGSDGSLTGYAGGLHRKQWLLNHESEYKQQTLF